MSEQNLSLNHRPLTLRKGEKLRHRSLVEPLFNGAGSFYAYPLRVVWRTLSDTQLSENFCGYVPKGIGSLQMMITVPKKKRRRAVDRVLMRRRIREAYRLNRLPLADAIANNNDIRTLSMSIVYIAEKNEPYNFVEARLKKLLSKLEEAVAPINHPSDAND